VDYKNFQYVSEINTDIVQVTSSNVLRTRFYANRGYSSVSIVIRLGYVGCTFAMFNWMV